MVDMLSDEWANRKDYQPNKGDEETVDLCKVISIPPQGCKRIINIYWDPKLGIDGQLVIDKED